jgi:predicted TIM-barrel fold metal-dependent hydrolase
MINSHQILDADTHVNEPADLWTTYMPAKYKQRAPRVVDAAFGAQWVFDDNQVFITTLTNVAGQSPVGWFPIAPEGYKGMRPGAWDPAARVEDMDIDMVDVHSLFPSYAAIMDSFLTAGADRDFYLAFVRAYNNWLSDFCSHAPERLIGLALIPHTGIKDALTEMKRAAKLTGIRGAFPTTWPNGGKHPMPEDETFWSLLEDLDMPAAIHIGFGGVEADPDLMKDADLMSRLASMPVINRERTAGSIMPVLSEFILGGVLDRHPNLRVGLIETGVGWVPFWCEQTDDNFLRHRFWTHCGLKLLPSDYWKRQCFATFQVDTYGLANRERLGIETIMWSSDYPHSGADWPSSARTIADQMRGIPGDEQALIVGGNMRRFYGLG